MTDQEQKLLKTLIIALKPKGIRDLAKILDISRLEAVNLVLSISNKSLSDKEGSELVLKIENILNERRRQTE